MILILAVFFSAMWLLQKFLFRPIVAILEERESEARLASESFAKAQAEFAAAAERVENELSLARREALKLREDLRAEGQQLRSAKTEAAKKESLETLAAASSEMDELARKASGELPSRVKALAQSLAEKVLGRVVEA
jgi:F-type H+-transporting ATPase subunit b